MKVVVAKEREANARMTVSSVSTTRTNVTEGIIKMITAITLEMVFKQGKISGCATASAINVDEIINAPQGFMLIGIPKRFMYSG